MLYKIHNPHKATQGFWVAGRLVFVKPGIDRDMDMTPEEADAARKRVEVSEIDMQKSDAPSGAADALDFSGAILATASPRESMQVGPRRDDGQDVTPNVGPSPVDLDSLTDDELRAMAKAKGLNLHHKTGRAKLLEALKD